MTKTKVILAGAGVSLGVLLGVLAQPVISGDNVYTQVKKFSNVLNITTKNYVDEVDSDKLVAAGVRGMLEELNDPHSVYIPPKEKEKIDEDFRGSFDGIGVSFEMLNDTITVVTPIIGGPSEKLGILAGDKIVRIDGEDAVGLESEEVPNRLKGPRGSTVSVDIFRAGEAGDGIINFEIVRDEIPIYSVDAHFLIDSSDVGYIRVNRFAAQTHNEMVEAATALQKQGMKKLILDLRFNPGGYLSQATLMADEFIGAGEKIVYTQGRRNEFNEVFRATSSGQLEDIPLIVLINESSASASEIVSGAVQDLDRGLIVGETSFGKGLVQQQYTLNDGSAFRLTTSKYYTPSGRLIQRPYKDRDKYYNLEGRADLEEGENIDHAGDNDSEERPEYSTKSGRAVYGGGGIVPDYIVKADTITDLYRQLFRKNIYRLFNDRYLPDMRKQIEQEFGNDFYAFDRGFQVDDVMIANLKTIAADKDVEWSDEDFAADDMKIRIVMKAEIARSVWNNNESVAVRLHIDRQAQKALELFPEAVKIARL